MRTSKLLTAAMLCGVVLVLAGCFEWLEARYPSPTTGKPVTALQLYAEQQAEAARLKTEQAETDRKLAEERAAARADLEAKVLAADAAYKSRLRAAEKSNRDAQAEADAAREEHEQALAAIEASGRATVERLTLAFNALGERGQRQTAELASRYGAAFEALQYQAERQGALVSAVVNNPLLQQVPVVGPALQGSTGQALIGLLGGGGAIGYMMRRSRRQSDESYTEGVRDAEAKAEKAREREHAAWDQSMAQMLALLHQSPAQLMAQLPAPALTPTPAPTGAPSGS